jgi:ubiquinone/menaquinone biosynthesis C-methylase UbiE
MTKGRQVMGLDYQRLYDRFAPWYAGAMRLFPMWLRYAREVLRWLPTEGRVLEIGHGPGVLLAELAQRQRYVLGVDLSWGMIREARRRLRRCELEATLVQGDVLHLPLADASLDGIALTFAFSAVPDGLGALREMARVLRPGGVLALVDAGIPSDGNLPGRALARTWALFGDFMRDEAALMRQAGLEVITRREFGAFRSIRLVVGRKLPMT